MENTDDRRMKDTPMLDVDRERMREEFEGFDDMTIDQFREAALERVNSLKDFVRELDS